MADFATKLKKDSKTKEQSLRQKMAQSVSGHAPSMIPGPRVVQGVVPTTDIKEVVPGVEELIADEEDRNTLAALVQSKIAIDSQLKPLEKQKEMVTDRIKAALSSYGITTMMCAGAKVSYTTTERKTINATKLVASGVDMEVIVACTDVTKSGMLKITPGKD